MKRSLRPDITVFLVVLGVTAAVWILRGVGLLTFIPGGLLWLLILLALGTGVFSGIQSTRR